APSTEPPSSSAPPASSSPTSSWAAAYRTCSAPTETTTTVSNSGHLLGRVLHRRRRRQAQCDGDFDRLLATFLIVGPFLTFFYGPYQAGFNAGPGGRHAVRGLRVPRAGRRRARRRSGGARSPCVPCRPAGGR